MRRDAENVTLITAVKGVVGIFDSLPFLVEAAAVMEYVDNLD
jgi:hypothetical protein